MRKNSGSPTAAAARSHSPTARHYALSGLPEAEAFLSHPVLGARLRECTAAVNAVTGRTANQLFGSPDDLKFHSSMTLFARVPGDPAPFRDKLRQAGFYADWKKQYGEAAFSTLEHYVGKLS